MELIGLVCAGQNIGERRLNSHVSAIFYLAPAPVTAPPRFQPDGAFTAALRDRVARAFVDRPLRGDPRVQRKGAIIIAVFALSWAALLITPSAALYYAATVIHAVAAAALACNIFHDANHGAFARTRRGNLAAARLACAMLGTGRAFWRIKHHKLHHHAANIQGWDDDVETRGFVRMSFTQPWRPRHKIGPLLVLPLYALNTIDWVVFKDYKQLLTGQLNPYQQVPRLRARELVEFFSCKAAHLILVLTPAVFQPAARVLIGFILFHLVTSLVLTSIFQLAHLNDCAEFPRLTGDNRIAYEWAAHQLRTTADFATANPFATWFLGGLNFQVEHHLFPQVCHTHYPEIQRIVRATATEYGVPYNEYPSIWAAFRGHFAHICMLARRPSSG